MARPSDEEIDERPAAATVRVTLSTHSEGGLTANDFELAAKIDSSA